MLLEIHLQNTNKHTGEIFLLKIKLAYFWFMHLAPILPESFSMKFSSLFFLEGIHTTEELTLKRCFINTLNTTHPNFQLRFMQAVRLHTNP